MKKLSDWAKESGFSYHSAYRKYQNNQIPGAYKTETGQIVVGDQGNNSLSVINEPIESPVFSVPFEEKGDSRGNRAAFTKPVNPYSQIENGILPFHYGPQGYGHGTDISVRESIILCQKCYFNFALLRTSIDLFTEFCVSDIFFRGGSSKSRDFFTALFKKLNLWQIQDCFYREYFRSGNVFLYVVNGQVNENDIKKLNQTFGTLLDSTGEIPLKYIVLNPADINATGNISFSNIRYYKMLTDYELEVLRNPRSEEDKEVLNSLAPEVQKQIKNKTNSTVRLELDKENIIAVFYKKQPYEAFAIPLAFGVLEDINFKKELRLVDQAVCRTISQAVLLITMGAEPDKGGVNPKNLAAMQNLFLNESATRVIVADYTTKAEFIIPDIANILDSKKYEMVDKDIAIGLNNVFLGQGEKFANQHAKIEIFIERLKHARRAFLNEFLIPEIKRIAQNIGLKNYPEPFYNDIDLKNELEYAKIYSHLAEIGILTPDETINAIETGVLPDKETSVQDQTEFKSLKDKGLYVPLVGAAKPADTGRPAGTKQKKSKNKIGQIGGSLSLVKIKENILLADKLINKLEDKLKSKFKIKALNELQKQTASQIVDVIVSNEEPGEWNKDETINSYLENPIDKNPERVKKVLEVGAEYQVDSYLASILYLSKRN